MNNEKTGKFKLKIFFKDGNQRTFYSYDRYSVFDPDKNTKKIVESQAEGLNRLKRLVEKYKKDFITALIYTNDKRNALVLKNVAGKKQFERKISFA